MILPNPSVSPFMIKEIHLDKTGNLYSVDIVKHPSAPQSYFKTATLRFDKQPDETELFTKMDPKISDCLNGYYGIKVKDLKYSDLWADYTCCNGLYLFFDTSRPAWMYVGKTTSRAIVDRVGAHQDLRVTGFLNCLVRGMAIKSITDNLKNPQNLEINNCVINGVLSDRQIIDELGEWRFIFIPVLNDCCKSFSDYAKAVGKLESFMIKALGSKYNSQ